MKMGVRIAYGAICAMLMLTGCTDIQKLVGLYQVSTPGSLATELDGRGNVIVLTWSSVSGNVQYAVQGYEPVTEGWINLASGLTQTTYADYIGSTDWRFGQIGTTWMKKYRVKAYDGSYNSDWSDEAAQSFLVRLEPNSESATPFALVSLGNDVYQPVASLRNTGEVRIDEVNVSWFIYNVAAGTGDKNFSQSVLPGQTVDLAGEVFSVSPGVIPTCDSGSCSVRLK